MVTRDVRSAVSAAAPVPRPVREPWVVRRRGSSPTRRTGLGRDGSAEGGVIGAIPRVV